MHKNKFPWFKNNKKWTYLDSAASSLRPQSVIDKIVEYYAFYGSNPHNSDSKLTYNVVKMIDGARENLCKLINCKKQEMIFTSGATESLCLIANGLEEFVKKNNEIILTFAEHGSNILPWQEMCKKNKAKIVYAFNDEPSINENDIIRLVNKNTKIVSFCDVSNLFGYELNIKKIVQGCKRKNKDIVFVIDATQSLPHKPINVKDCDIDFMVASSHKMCGPSGVGLCYINEKWINKIKPLRLGGDMNSTIQLNDYTFASSPYKFEGGTPNTSGIIGWGEAIKFLTKIGWDKIRKHDSDLCSYINKKFKELTNVIIFNKPKTIPIILFNVVGVSSQDLSSYLSNKGIVVRSGLSCAKLANKVLNADSVVRASFYIYNDKKDVDILINALKSFKKGDELSHVI